MAAALIAYVAFAMGQASGDRRAARAELALSHVQRDAAQREVIAAEKARGEERARVEAVAQAAKQAEQRAQDAEARADRAVSAGNELRKHWAGCATDLVSRDAATAAELERQDGLRRADLREVLRLVGRLQAQRDGLIEAYEALRP
nr:hypothetical protein [Luteimonas saliphila]